MRCGGVMGKSRREFLTQTTLGLFVAATAHRSVAQSSDELPPASPGAFGTAPAVGPEVLTTTFAEAEKLVQFPLTPSELRMAAGSWRKTMASLYGRRPGTRKLALETTLAPAS